MRQRPVIGGKDAIGTRHEEDVARGYVAVDDIGRVGDMHRVGQQPDQLRGNVGIDGTGVAGEPVVQALAAELLGDIGNPVVISHLVDRDDVGMGNPRGNFCFAAKPPLLARIDENLQPGDFQRLAADEFGVDHLVDFGEAPLADLADDPILAKHSLGGRDLLLCGHSPEDENDIEQFRHLRRDLSPHILIVARGGSEPGELVINRCEPDELRVVELRGAVAGGGVARWLPVADRRSGRMSRQVIRQLGWMRHAAAVVFRSGLRQGAVIRALSGSTPAPGPTLSSRHPQTAPSCVRSGRTSFPPTVSSAGPRHGAREGGRALL